MLRGNRVGTAKHLFGEGGFIVTKTVPVGAILTEDFDMTLKIGCNDDVAVRVVAASKVGRGLFWFSGFVEIGSGRCMWEAGVDWSVFIDG